MKDLDELMLENDAAKLLKCSQRTLQGWRTQHKGPRFVKLGKRCIRYRLKDLIDFISQRTQPET